MSNVEIPHIYNNITQIQSPYQMNLSQPKFNNQIKKIVADNITNINYFRQISIIILFAALVILLAVQIYNIQFNRKGQKYDKKQDYYQNDNDVEAQIQFLSQQQQAIDIENYLKSKDQKNDNGGNQENIQGPDMLNKKKKINFGIISRFLMSDDQTDNDFSQNTTIDSKNQRNSNFSRRSIEGTCNCKSENQNNNKQLQFCIVCKIEKQNTYQRASYNSQRSQNLPSNYQSDGNCMENEDFQQYHQPYEINYQNLQESQQHHAYSIKELFNHDLNISQDSQNNQQSTPIPQVNKKIPKIALNFTKWKLQQRMVAELREIQNPQLIQKKIEKFTKAFEILDQLGADNCVDPEDFDQEDLEDDMFKNLEIKDIEDLLNKSESQSDSGQNDQKEKVQDMSKSLASSINNEEQDENEYEEFQEQLLMDTNDSEIMKLDEESDYLQFMDIDEQIRIYDQSQEYDENDQFFLNLKLTKKRMLALQNNMERNTAPESGLTKIKIQGLEEVTEMAEESDITSQFTYFENDDLNSSQGSYSSSSQFSLDQEINERIKMTEQIKEIETKSKQLFLNAPIQFKFDIEDYENCKLNGEIKKIISQLNVKIPIIHLKNQNYLVGTKIFKLILQKTKSQNNITLEFPQKCKEFYSSQSIFNCIENTPINLVDFLQKYEQFQLMQLTFLQEKCGQSSLQQIIQQLIEGKKIGDISEKEMKIFISYASKYIK